VTEDPLPLFHRCCRARLEGKSHRCLPQRGTFQRGAFPRALSRVG